MAYFGFVFGAGFLLGAVRVPLFEPIFGRFITTLIEAPIMIVVIASTARYVTTKFDLSGHRPALLFVGLFAFCLAAIADFFVGLFVRQIGFGEQLRYFTTSAGITYLMLLTLFGAMPLIGEIWRRRA